MKSNKNRGLLAYLAFAIVIIIIMLVAFNSLASSADKPTYSDVLGYFDNLQVTEFKFDLGTGKLEYKLEGSDKTLTYKVPNVNAFYNEIFGNGENDFNYRKEYNAVHEAPLKYEVVTTTNVGGLLVSLIPTILLIGGMVFLSIFMFRNVGPGGKNPVGKARIRTDADIISKVTFADVAGADEEKAELQEIVELLKDPKKYRDIGAKIPKGVLLVGPPGNGKTLLAKAVAGEAGVPFLSLSGSDFVELYVGAGAARVRDLFDQAKKSAPSIVFIDEIDAVGRHRGAGLGGGHDEREQTLNQLLVEMDGFTGDAGVIIIAATNRRDVLDPALLRPGRFDRQVYVNYPDLKGREAILKVHTKNKPLAPDVDLKEIAGTTPGFSGADLANLINEAALLAAKRGNKAITAQDMSDAATKVIVGPEKRSRVVTPESRKLTAYHEAGHALCYYYCPTQDKVGEISIVPTGFAGGYTMSAPDQDKDFITKTEMKERIVTLLGGRAAEKVVLDDISTGASNDLERATKIARSMVTKYGFSDKIGPVVYGSNDDEVFLGRDYNAQKVYSENIASEIDAEMRAIVHGAYSDAINILTDHIDKLHAVAQYLLKHEKMNGEQFERLMNGEDLEPKAITEESVAETADVEMPVAESESDI